MLTRLVQKARAFIESLLFTFILMNLIFKVVYFVELLKFTSTSFISSGSIKATTFPTKQPLSVASIASWMTSSVATDSTV